MTAIDNRMWCKECGAVKMITRGGAVLCPNGHGMVLSNSGITPSQLKEAWANSFPRATKATPGIPAVAKYMITGLDGLWRFSRKAGSRTSRLKWLEKMPADAVVAGYDGKVFYFKKANG